MVWWPYLYPLNRIVEYALCPKVNFSLNIIGRRKSSCGRVKVFKWPIRNSIRVLLIPKYTSHSGAWRSSYSRSLSWRCSSLKLSLVMQIMFFSPGSTLHWCVDQHGPSYKHLYWLTMIDFFFLYHLYWLPIIDLFFIASFSFCLSPRYFLLITCTVLFSYTLIYTFFHLSTT